MSSIYKKLLEIQTELNCPKTLYNSFGKYHYRSAETILEALKPLLSKAQATLVINDEVVIVGDRYYIKATAKIFDSEGEVTSTAYAREDEKKTGMDMAQLTGACSSYARKYALNGLFAIDDTKDSDTTNQHGKGDTSETGTKKETKASDKPKAQPFDSSKMVKILKDTAKGLGMTDEELMDFASAEYSVASLEQLAREQGLALLQTMKMYPKKEVE